MSCPMPDFNSFTFLVWVHFFVQSQTADETGKVGRNEKTVESAKLLDNPGEVIVGFEGYF